MSCQDLSKFSFVIMVIRPIVDLLFALWDGNYEYLIRLWPREDDIADCDIPK